MACSSRRRKPICIRPPNPSLLRVSPAGSRPTAAGSRLSLPGGPIQLPDDCRWTVYFVKKRIAAAVVMESAMILDRMTGEKREVDVLQHHGSRDQVGAEQRLLGRHRCGGPPKDSVLKPDA